MNNILSASKMRLNIILPIVTVLLGTSAHAAPKVVASIAPVHSLVSMVMEGVAEPELLLDANISPHDFAMKPSNARAIQNADAVFWVGPGLEAFLTKPLEALGSKDSSFALIDATGLTLLDFRDAEKIGAFEHHDDDNGHEAEHDHEESHEKEHDHAGHHHTGEHDPHIWLDPHNAAAMLEAIAIRLEKLDPENAETYRSNAQTALGKMEELETTISKKLSGFGDQSFIAFHDGTQYFENRFGLKAKGLLLDNPEVSPSAARMKSLRDLLQTDGISCMFSEVQFSSDVTATLTEGMNVKVEVLDPLGAGLEPGADLYGALLSRVAASFENCLS